MKKIVIGLLIVAVLMMGFEMIYAATAARLHVKPFTSTSKTTTAQYTGSWDSVLTVRDTSFFGGVDTGYVMLRVSGMVNLSPGGKLYIGWNYNAGSKDSTYKPKETTIVSLPKWARGSMTIPFVDHYVFKQDTTTGLAGTSYYLNVATGGSSGIERAVITNMTGTVTTTLR